MSKIIRDKQYLALVTVRAQGINALAIQHHIYIPYIYTENIKTDGLGTRRKNNLTTSPTSISSATVCTEAWRQAGLLRRWCRG
jgi:hypothetical protein